MKKLLVLAMVATIAVSASADLVGHWEFDDGFPATTDGSGHLVGGIGGATVGPQLGVAWSSGVIPGYDAGGVEGGAGAFSGNTGLFPNEYGTTGRFAGGAFAGQPVGASAWTYSAFVKTDSTQAYQGIISMGHQDDGSYACLDIRGNGDLAIETWSNGGVGGHRDNVATGTALNDGEWHHVAMTYDGGVTTKLYADGVEVGALAMASAFNIGSGNQNFAIGQWVKLRLAQYTTGRGFDGLIDDVRAYDSALTGAEIAALPEPATMALFGLGGLFLRRRK